MAMGDELTCGVAEKPDCLPCVPCGQPALEPQLAAFIIVNVGVFALQYRAVRINWYHITLLLSFFILVVYTHVYIGFNSPAQVLTGAAIGGAFALVWELFVARILARYFDRVLAWPLVRRFGYKDTLMHSDLPVAGDPAPMASIE
jgi:hypothetical protein